MAKPDLRKARMRKVKETQKIIYEDNPKYKDLGLNKKYHILTYGCQGNEADSEVMAGIFESLGFTYCEDAAKSDVVLLNTCAIRENAEQKIAKSQKALEAAKNKVQVEENALKNNNQYKQLKKDYSKITKEINNDFSVFNK